MVAVYSQTQYAEKDHEVQMKEIGYAEGDAEQYAQYSEPRVGVSAIAIVHIALFLLCFQCL